MDGYSTGSGPLSRQRARRERFYGLFIREIGKPREAAAAEAAAYSSIGAEEQNVKDTSAEIRTDPVTQPMLLTGKPVAITDRHSSTSDRVGDGQAGRQAC
uniref:Uncharacterized protein n=1 Tax=Oryza rufipogon TaxID=4529 RepID=A0A0E0NRL6_ORYRU